MRTLKYLLFFLTACMAAPVLAQPEAEFVRVVRQYTLKADGTLQTHYRKELTLFTHTAMNGTYGETFINYHPEFQTLTINEAYTRRPDGSIEHTPKNAFVDVLPSAAAGAPDFNALRERVVVHTALELGATLVLDYTLTTRPGFGTFVLDEPLQETSPIKKLELSIETPKNVPYRTELYGTLYQGISNNDGHYTATLYDLPARSREQLLPTGGRGEVRVLCAPQEQQPLTSLFEEEIPTALISVADSVCRLAGATGSDARREAIVSYVSRNFQAVPLTFSLTGDRLRPALRILQTGYATDAERAKLLTLMLRAAGVPATAAGAWPSYFSTSLCTAHNASRWLVRTGSGDSAVCWNAQKGERVNPNLKADVERLLTAGGESIPTQGEPLLVRRTDTLSVTATTARDGFVVFSLPRNGKGADSWKANALPRLRESELELPSMIDEEDVYVVCPDENLELQGVPSNFKTSVPCGEMSQTCEPLNGNRLLITRRLTINQTCFYTTEYAALRNLLSEWASPSRTLLLFKVR